VPTQSRESLTGLPGRGLLLLKLAPACLLVRALRYGLAHI